MNKGQLNKIAKKLAKYKMPRQDKDTYRFLFHGTRKEYENLITDLRKYEETV